MRLAYGLHAVLHIRITRVEDKHLHRRERLHAPRGNALSLPLTITGYTLSPFTFWHSQYPVCEKFLSFPVYSYVSAFF